LGDERPDKEGFFGRSGFGGAGEKKTSRAKEEQRDRKIVKQCRREIERGGIKRPFSQAGGLGRPDRRSPQNSREGSTVEEGKSGGVNLYL